MTKIARGLFALAFSTLLALAVTLGVVPAVAQITTPGPGKHLFTIPGVVNAGGVGTYFTCTSITTESQDVTVEVFNQTGFPSGSATVTVSGGRTSRFGTNVPTAAGLAGANLGSGVVGAGVARISSTVNKKLVCSAVVADSTASNIVGTSLPVLSKFKQSGD